MTASMPTADLTAELATLRLELIELAFVLDRRGQCEAADVANLVVARLQEIGVSPIASP